MRAAPPRSDVFFDANVLLYLPEQAGEKSNRATELLAGGGVVSAQVLGEVTNTMRSKRWKMPWPEMHAFLATIRANTFALPVTGETHARAVRYAERYQIQYFDALRVASAVLCGCTTLYSDDIHDGLTIDGLTARTPFD